MVPALSNYTYIKKGVPMSAKNVFNKIGFLSLMAATGLFGTSIGLGAMRL
jgi:hypothetical protein